MSYFDRRKQPHGQALHCKIISRPLAILCSCKFIPYRLCIKSATSPAVPANAVNFGLGVGRPRSYDATVPLEPASFSRLTAVGMASTSWK